LLTASLVFTPVGAAVLKRVTNSCGPCLLVATMQFGDQRVLFDATAVSRPAARSQAKPFRASDHWTWRLTTRVGSSSISSAEVRLGTPAHPGALLARLCGPCKSGVSGRMRLGTGLAGVLSRGVICHANCSPAQSWPLGAYLMVKIDNITTALTGQLRYCASNQYRNRNSCKPSGY